MFNRHSHSSISSSDNNTVTPSEDQSTSIYDITSNSNSNNNNVNNRRNERDADGDSVDPRPATYRESSVPNVEQENSLKDRIRFFTSSTLNRNSSGSMSMPFVASPSFHSNPNRQQVYTPRRSRSRATSLANSVDHRLSIIDEDNPSPPQQPDPLPPRPAKTSHRPLHRRFGLGEPPKYDGGSSPPGYTFWDVNGRHSEKLEDIRNNPAIARRGGWGKICLIFWILLLIILGLAVGLGVGLSKNKKNNDSSSPAPASASATSLATNGPFPQGSYTFAVYLTQTRQSCTSSPSSFTCNPGTLYNTSVSGSKAQFQWKITPSSSSTTNGDNNRNFTISSSPNPFSIDFKDVGLQLLDKGMDTERYNFQTTVQKIVFPQQSFSVKCYYNSTLLNANLYTKKPKDNIPTTSSSRSSSRLLRARDAEEQLEDDETDVVVEDGSSFGLPSTLYKRQASSSSPAYSDWPFASDISQSVGGGQGVPDCYQYDVNKPDQVGTRVTEGYTTRGAGEFCSCVWGNWGLT